MTRQSSRRRENAGHPGTSRAKEQPAPRQDQTDQVKGQAAVKASQANQSAGAKAGQQATSGNQPPAKLDRQGRPIAAKDQQPAGTSQAENQANPVYKLEVTIDGINYVLKSDRPKAEMEAIVDYAKREIESLSGHGQLNKAMQATLACINITDQLFAERKARDSKLEALEHRQDESSSLQAEVESLRKDLEEMGQATSAREEDLVQVQKKLAEADRKLLDLTQQFQDYQQSHQ